METGGRVSSPRESEDSARGRFDALLARLLASGELCLAYRPTKAAQLVDIGRSKFYELVARGAIPTVIIGGQRRVTLAALLDLLDNDENPGR
jgi:excisionase family DNA binding protein